jgi:hypothetical protein
MRGTQVLWYAGTMLTALAMLAASATTAAPDQTPTPQERGGAAEESPAPSVLPQDR